MSVVLIYKNDDAAYEAWYDAHHGSYAVNVHPGRNDAASHSVQSHCVASPHARNTCSPRTVRFVARVGGRYWSWRRSLVRRLEQGVLYIV